MTQIEQISKRIDRCDEEISGAERYLLSHPGDRGASLWFLDWAYEKSELLRELAIALNERSAA